ncbi:hypothetical protein MAPG_01364, partial [Magnaporthiopsis poae ATCC 64411]
GGNQGPGRGGDPPDVPWPPLPPLPPLPPWPPISHKPDPTPRPPGPDPLPPPQPSTAKPDPPTNPPKTKDLPESTGRPEPPKEDPKPTKPLEQPNKPSTTPVPITQSASPSKSDEASDKPLVPIPIFPPGSGKDDRPTQSDGKGGNTPPNPPPKPPPPQTTREPVNSGEETSPRPPVNEKDKSTPSPPVPLIPAPVAASATPTPRPKRPGGSDSEQLTGGGDDSGPRPEERPGDPGDAGKQRTDESWRPVASIDWAEPSVVVTTDGNGIKTTKMMTPAPVSATLTQVLRDQQGKPTRTKLTTRAVPPRTVTLTDAAGMPTATVTQWPRVPKPSAEASSNGNPAGVKSYYLGKSAHLAALFLPVLLAVVTLAAARMVETSARQMHPYHRLTHPSGAPAKDSICMRAGVFHSIPAALRSLAPEGGVLRYPPVLFLSKLLLLVAAVLVPLWPEAFAIRQNEDLCAPEVRPCAATLVVSPPNARAAMGFLGLMSVISLVVLVSTFRWRTGVASNPWSIIGTAALAGNPEVRSLLLSLPTTGNSRAVVEKTTTEGESTAAMAAARVKGRITHEQLLRAVGNRRFRL